MNGRRWGFLLPLAASSVNSGYFELSQSPPTTLLAVAGGLGVGGLEDLHSPARHSVPLHVGLLGLFSISLARDSKF